VSVTYQRLLNVVGIHYEFVHHTCNVANAPGKIRKSNCHKVKIIIIKFLEHGILNIVSRTLISFVNVL